MGIKSLTNTIKKYSPDSIQHEIYINYLEKKSIDASLIIYQRRYSPNTKILRNKDGKITNCINGLFYDMNYISLNISHIYL